jgi:cytochrome bd-type quinol oxidase subunit 2
MKFFPSHVKDKRKNISLSAIFGLSCVVVGIVVSIYVIRYYLAKSSDKDVRKSAQSVASILNALQIQVTNFVYSFIATALTDFENHRTDTEYEDSMVLKIFIFQFVNRQVCRKYTLGQ